MNRKLKVTFFQRKPREDGNFSVEFIFSDLRNRLEDRIDSDVKISKFFNDGVFRKIYNILEASGRQGAGINHVTGEIHFLALLMKKKKVVLTILDCGMLLRKKTPVRHITKLLYLTLPVKSAGYITAISETTKREIIKYTDCPPDKISVIPVGVDSIYQACPKEFNTSKPNILHIGLSENKNIFRLIEAIKGINCHLTIIGKLSSDHIEKLKENSIDYSSASNLSQKEMFEKYKECDILAFVSTSEGFGMPIIEANSVERVVITGNLSSMPEVAGDAAHLVDPYNVDEIRNGVLKLIGDREYREKLINNGRQNRLRFDSDKIAGLYYDLYSKIYNEPE